MKFKLAFALHNHQPVGNFAAVFENANNRCYLPFLKLAKQFPNFRFSLHQSGILWDWQKEHHPEFFELVGEMVDSGQIELLSGGFYEPILTAIPDRDKIGQLQMLTRYLKDHFGVDARGMWLAERVWEPHLPKVINECNLHYLPIDDTHFKYAGYTEEELSGRFITEEEGKTVSLFPILNRLRYLIPFGQHHEIVEFLQKFRNNHPAGLATYADDGEKFGVWPGTFKHCYEDKWLENFFRTIEENSDWLEVIPLGEAVDKTEPAGRVYLPSASYHEMLHWALPPKSFVSFEDFEAKLKEYDLIETYGQFVRGGHWRGFLAKYEEANMMHKKMLAVSDLLADLDEKSNLDHNRLESARQLLYAGQCNCPYWHGVFGGLYLPHLRWAIYRKLIEAETILREISDQKVFAFCEDRDRDGHEDIIVGGKNLSMVLSPRYGGRIAELDCLDSGINLTDCLQRRREGYHRRLLNLQQEPENKSTKSIHDMVATKEEGLDKLIVEDRHLRRPLIDHFLSDDTSIDDFMSAQYKELGDFVIGKYENSIIEDGNNYNISLRRQGNVWQGDFNCPLSLEKTIRFPKSGNQIVIDYRLFQDRLELMPVRFAVEFDFNLLAPDAVDRYVMIDGQKPKNNFHLAAVDENRHVSNVSYLDEYQNVVVKLETDHPAMVWRMPIHTVSLSEGGFEKVFQGSCTLFIYETSLARQEEYRISLSLFAGPLENLFSKNNPHSLSQQKA